MSVEDGWRSREGSPRDGESRRQGASPAGRGRHGNGYPEPGHRMLATGALDAARNMPPFDYLPADIRRPRDEGARRRALQPHSRRRATRAAAIGTEKYRRRSLAWPTTITPLSPASHGLPASLPSDDLGRPLCRLRLRRRRLVFHRRVWLLPGPLNLGGSPGFQLPRQCLCSLHQHGPAAS